MADALSLREQAVAARGFTFHVLHAPSRDDEGTLVLHHGIGSTAMTFMLFVQHLRVLNPRLGVLMYDARFHGRTLADAGVPFDLSLDALCGDLQHILGVVLPPAERVALLGHSMGGTVVAKVASEMGKAASLRGLIVVDAVEGYARQALSSMSALLATWPQSFGSVAEAVDWHLAAGHLLRNRDSAELSVPACLAPTSAGRLEWRLDLHKTKPFWDTWFSGLDAYFLRAAAARMLVLPGTVRLDTDLTRAQMQGKFQMVIYPDSGHFVQEDVPAKLAETVCHFWSRNGHPIRIVPKFGQLRTD